MGAAIETGVSGVGRVEECSDGDFANATFSASVGGMSRTRKMAATLSVKVHATSWASGETGGAIGDVFR